MENYTIQTHVTIGLIFYGFIITMYEPLFEMICGKRPKDKLRQVKEEGEAALKKHHLGWYYALKLALLFAGMGICAFVWPVFAVTYTAGLIYAIVLRHKK